jgi:hypothetical protein
MAQKRYRGKITKGKRKGKQGFITQREYIKQNINNINFDPAELNESESKIYKQILKNEKISAKAKQRPRIKGKFLNKEQTKYLKKVFKDTGKEFTQENVNLYLNNEIYFAFQSLYITDVINDHKGIVKINGKELSKSDAIIEFDKLNRENYREWSDTLGINQDKIFFIVYDAYYTPATQILNIDTMVNDQTRIITSPPQGEINMAKYLAEIERLKYLTAK